MGYWRVACQAAGVRLARRWIETSLRPGRTAARYSRAAMPRRRQVSSTERIAATFGRASRLPKWIQFLRLCARAHNRNYAQSGIMCRS